MMLPEDGAAAVQWGQLIGSLTHHVGFRAKSMPEITELVRPLSLSGGRVRVTIARVVQPRILALVRVPRLENDPNDEKRKARCPADGESRDHFHENRQRCSTVTAVTLDDGPFSTARVRVCSEHAAWRISFQCRALAESSAR